MADAITDLAALIERVRTEADAAGYARAISDIENAIAPLKAFGSTKMPNLASLGIKLAGPVENDAAPRARKGENKDRARQALRDGGPKLTTQEVRNHIEREQGVLLPYSSVKQALGQLAGDDEVRRADDGRWSLTGIRQGVIFDANEAI